MEEELNCSVREAGGWQELGRFEAVREGRRKKLWSAVGRREKKAVSGVGWATRYSSVPYTSSAFRAGMGS